MSHEFEEKLTNLDPDSVYDRYGNLILDYHILLASLTSIAGVTLATTAGSLNWDTGLTAVGLLAANTVASMATTWINSTKLLSKGGLSGIIEDKIISDKQTTRDQIALALPYPDSNKLSAEMGFNFCRERLLSEYSRFKDYAKVHRVFIRGVSDLIFGYQSD